MATVGLLGTVSFNLAVYVHAWLRPDYRSTRQFISELSNGPTGWVQKLNFVGFGSAVVVLASAVWGMGSTRRTRLGAGSVALTGVALIGAGVFDIDPLPVVTLSVAGALHVAAAVLLFASLAAAQLLLANAMGPLKGFSLFAAAVSIPSIAAPLFFFGPFGNALVEPVLPWAGVLQRITAASFSLWLVALALRLRAADSAPATR